VPALCRPYALPPAELPDCGGGPAVRAAAFIGMPTGPRVMQLSELLAAGAPLEIRGPGWREENLPHTAPAAMAFHGLGEHLRQSPHWPRVHAHARGPLSDAELPGYVRGCQAILGLNQATDRAGRQLSYLKLRDLEFPGLGACYLTEHNDDVSAALDMGREVLTYRSLAEAAELLRELPTQPARVAQIGAAGRRRVLAEHTWAARLPELAAALR
jgi:hypothetical protein